MTTQNLTPAPFQQKQVDLSLADLLNLKKKEIMLELNCHALATVQSFNPDNQTITASMNYKKSYTRADSQGVYRETYENYAVLLDMPAVFPRGGGAVLTFPIAQGDVCVVMFNDRNMDNYLQSGQVAPVANNRLHSFSDGIALVGISPFNSSLDFDMDRAGLSWGTTEIKLNQNKVRVQNATRNLNTVLQSLITAIQAITVSGVTTGAGVSGAPVNASTFATIATQLGELIE